MPRSGNWDAAEIDTGEPFALARMFHGWLDAGKRRLLGIAGFQPNATSFLKGIF
jgi:hypothetical protein